MKLLLAATPLYTLQFFSIFSCGDSFFNSNKYLSQQMIKLIKNETSVAVRSKSLKTNAQFSNLKIYYSINTKKIVEIGKTPYRDPIYEAKGYAKIEFNFSGQFEDIPKINRHISNHYSHPLDRYGVTKVNIIVSAKGRNSTPLKNETHKLRRGKNTINFCSFSSISGDVREINIEIESYEFNGKKHFDV